MLSSWSFGLILDSLGPFAGDVRSENTICDFGCQASFESEGQAAAFLPAESLRSKEGDLNQSLQVRVVLHGRCGDRSP